MNFVLKRTLDMYYILTNNLSKEYVVLEAFPTEAISSGRAWRVPEKLTRGKTSLESQLAFPVPYYSGELAVLPNHHARERFSCYLGRLKLDEVLGRGL